MNASTETWPRPHRLTAEEYYRMAEVGLLAPDARVELIEGAIVDMAPIGSRHGAVVDRLAKLLIEAAAGDNAIVGIQRPVRLSRFSEPQPDLVLLRGRADSYFNGHPSAEDVQLIVEVSDTTLRFDQGAKAHLYARHGVPELWVVDVVSQRMKVFREPGADGYLSSTSGRPGVMTIASAGPLILDLSDLFSFG